MLFLDLTGSTSLAEAMDPESYRHVMTRFFSDVPAVIRQAVALLSDNDTVYLQVAARTD